MTKHNGPIRIIGFTIPWVNTPRVITHEGRSLSPTVDLSLSSIERICDQALLYRWNPDIHNK